MTPRRGPSRGALVGVVGVFGVVALAIGPLVAAAQGAPAAASTATATPTTATATAAPAAPPVAVRRPTTPELDARGQALSRERGCTACHAPEGKRVGPGFAQIAARYRADPEADERIPQKIRNGSVGTWGRIIMPRQTQVTEAEAKLLGAWVLSRPGS
jgi:cytochrome c